jgi:hypothetical protein
MFNDSFAVLMMIPRESHWMREEMICNFHRRSHYWPSSLDIELLGSTSTIRNMDCSYSDLRYSTHAVRQNAKVHQIFGKFRKLVWAAGVWGRQINVFVVDFWQCCGHMHCVAYRSES